VGIDGSPSSLDALDWAARHAAATATALEIVTAWEWPSTYGSPLPLPEGFDPEADAAHLLDDAEARVRKAFPDVPIRKVVREGHPASVLVECSKDASLLVVGCRGHGAFVGMVLGSVSEHCVTNAHCPVVVLRPS